jgi:hypothetical protein
MTQDWQKANRDYLMASLATIQELLEHHAAGSKSKDKAERGKQAVRREEEALAALPSPSALEMLCAIFGLAPFERDILLLCAGIELSSDFARYCASAQGSDDCAYPTFSLALGILPESHWSALAPASPLRYWRLIEVGQGSSLTSSPLRLDERILHYLTGVQQLDKRLIDSVLPPPQEQDFVETQRIVVDRIINLWSPNDGISEWSVVQLCGIDHATKGTMVAKACEALGSPLYVIHADDAQPGSDWRAMILLWEREARLSGNVLMIDCGVEEVPETKRFVHAFADRLMGRLAIASRDALPLSSRRMITLDVQRPTTTEQQSLWQATLGPTAAQLDGDIDHLVSQFSLSQTHIRTAAAEALTPFKDTKITCDDPVEDLGRRLWEACLVQARPRLDGTAQRIELKAAWDELVLPELQLQTLRTMAIQSRHRARVYEEWGFAAKSARGLGLSALFTGPSGTGKTMAAEILARELKLDLYRIDLSAVVSKYIGETEKNLRRVFDGADAGGAVLLFDEADALFGKRSEVKDSHDRYANIEISYLLQRMESYRGLAILTTNFEEALDTAFMRRLRFVVHFPFPDAGLRAEIWRRIFPAEVPTNGLDYGKLARLNVAGGDIRNIAMSAAFIAAGEDGKVDMQHLLQATRGEYAKLKKTLTDSEIGDWT